MSLKRLFVAVPISEPLQKEILAFQRKFKELDVRWLSGCNIHITLIPPWYEENDERVKIILKKLENKIGAFEFKVEKVAYGPDPRRPRLIWAEGPTPSKLIQLKKELEQILFKEKIIREIEKRPFRLHITLARFRPENFKTFPIKILNEKIDWQQQVNSIVLMQSHLTPTHAEYKILDTIKI